MTQDISHILRDWPYEGGQINVRLVQGDDDEPRIQMRLDLGLLQMEVSGRPDASRPQGFESFLEYCEARLDHADGEEECRLLREEAVQYYHRYIALLVLGDYDGVLRDTARNLRVIELCAQFAETEEDRTILEQFRPYVTMMRVRALASQMVVDDEPKVALWAIDDGIEVIRKQYEEAGRGGDFEEASEIQLLRAMRDELALKLPASQKNELRERLRKAIESENYELAAILRDELRMLKE